MTKLRWLLLTAFLAPAGFGTADPIPFTVGLDKFPPASDPVNGEGYATIIAGLRQKSLLDYPPGVDVYRFIYCDAWYRGRLAVIIRQNGQAEFEGVVPASHPIHGRLGIAAAVSRRLSAGEWHRFEALMRRADFWRLGSKPDHDGLDGYIYVIEARVSGKYHYAIRWAPEDFPEDRAFANLARWINHLVPDVGTATTSDGYDITTKDGAPITTRH